MLYPARDPLVPTLSIPQHIECAGRLVDFLFHLIPEVQKTATRPARYDILAVAMAEINATLAARLMPVCQLEDGLGLGLSASAGDGAGAEDISLADLHKLIVWITRYQETMRTVYCPVPSSNDSSAFSSPSSSSPKGLGMPPTSPTSSAFLSETAARALPSYCEIFDALQPLCRR